MIQYESDTNAQSISEASLSHGFAQVISRPTRITDHTATLIDHVYTNTLPQTTSTGILINDISDHLGTYININLKNNSVSNRHPTQNSLSSNLPYRRFTAENLEHFRQLISTESWSTTTQESTCQEKYDRFTETYNKQYDCAFPETYNTKKRKTQRKNPKPWILPWFEEACDRKNRLHHDFIKAPSIANKIKYCKMKKFVNKHIKLSKNKYYTNYFNEHSNNSKMQWQMINNLLNRNRKKNAHIKLKLKDGTTITAPKAVANTFNNYFAI